MFSLGEKDAFVKKFLDISVKASTFDKKQNISLGIYRNDFMVDTVKKFIFQIELNTIAACLGYFSDKMRKYYQDFSNLFPTEYANINLENIPNKPYNIESIADSMLEAVKLFSPNEHKNMLIVFVVQEVERNEYDARSVQNALWEKQ